jgi:hypothetical protein
MSNRCGHCSLADQKRHESVNKSHIDEYWMVSKILMKPAKE